MFIWKSSFLSFLFVPFTSPSLSSSAKISVVASAPVVCNPSITASHDNRRPNDYTLLNRQLLHSFPRKTCGFFRTSYRSGSHCCCSGEDGISTPCFGLQRWLTADAAIFQCQARSLSFDRGARMWRVLTSFRLPPRAV